MTDPVTVLSGAGKTIYVGYKAIDTISNLNKVLRKGGETAGNFDTTLRNTNATLGTFNTLSMNANTFVENDLKNALKIALGGWLLFCGSDIFEKCVKSEQTGTYLDYLRFAQPTIMNLIGWAFLIYGFYKWMKPQTNVSHLKVKIISPEELTDISYDPVADRSSSEAVHKCRYNGKDAALKLYEHHEQFDAEQKEKQLLRLEPHQFILSYHGKLVVPVGHIYNPTWFSSWIYSPSPQKNSTGLVFEWAAQGSLDKYLERNKTILTSQDKYKISLSIVLGLIHIHKNKLVHQNIKAENILMHDNYPKIAGFESRKIDFNDKTFLSAKAGYSPEVLKKLSSCSADKNCTSQSDIFSLGILLWEIAMCRPAQRTPEEIRKGEFKLANQSTMFTKAIQMCTQVKSSNRPSANRVYKLLLTESQTPSLQLR